MHENDLEQLEREYPSTPLGKLRSVVEKTAAGRFGVGKLLKRAAVSAVFFERDDGSLELLFMQRASDPRDPWSGHMAFPGGRVEDFDAGTRGAAERETLEEVGLDLQKKAEWLGRMSDVRALDKGRVLPLVITPHVYQVKRKPQLSFNYEVADAVWVPLEFLLERSNRGEMNYTIAGLSKRLPCYRYEGKVIWGLTLRMVDEILDNWSRLA